MDRVFSMAGFGTVVTGTLLDGRMEVGQEVEFAPSGLRGRIRGLQSHRSRLESAAPGSRVAANVSGVEVQAVTRRGPGCRAPAHDQAPDVRLRCLRARHAIAHSMEVKIFLGTAQRVGRVRLLERDRIPPGEEGWGQLVLRQPVVAGRGDRLVVRRPSPGETLGGGTISDPQPGRLHRRRDAETLGRLERMLVGDPEEGLLDAARAAEPAAIRTLAESADLDAMRAVELARRLAKAGRLKDLRGDAQPLTLDSLVIADTAWQELTRRAAALLGDYQSSFTLRFGMPREELKSRLGLEGKVFGACLEAWTRDGVLQETSGAVALAGHSPAPSESELVRIDRAMARLEGAVFATDGQGGRCGAGSVCLPGDDARCHAGLRLGGLRRGCLCRAGAPGGGPSGERGRGNGGADPRRV
jgi:selenocysteine-specific elongation factor